MLIHTTKTSRLTPICISGEDNGIEDIFSRPFQKGKLFAAENNLTKYFQNNSPLIKGHYWTKFTLPPKWTQQVLLCLHEKLLMLRSILRLPRISKNSGRHGNAIPPHGTSTPSSKTVNNRTSSLLSHIFLHGYEKLTTTRAFKSISQPLLRRYLSSLCPSTWFENPVPSKLRNTTTSSPSNA